MEILEMIKYIDDNITNCDLLQNERVQNNINELLVRVFNHMNKVGVKELSQIELYFLCLTFLKKMELMYWDSKSGSDLERSLFNISNEAFKNERHAELYYEDVIKNGDKYNSTEDLIECVKRQIDLYKQACNVCEEYQDKNNG